MTTKLRRRLARAPLGAGALALALAIAAPAPALAQKPRAGAQHDAKKKPAAHGAGARKDQHKAGARKPAAHKPAAAKAPEAPAPPAPPIELSLPIQRATLSNGLRVVLSPDRTSPTVGVSVTYDVGSRVEEKGRSGFAHLFEHMMFQGSKNVAKGEHVRLVVGHGGSMDGTTSPDRTSYFESLPSSELALALWLEADRMKSLEVTAENFENQRLVVKEEHRKAVSNAAYGPSQIKLGELVYQGYWPYEHNPIGSMADIDAARLEWARAFFAAHYGPDTAILTITGDFDPDEAMALVKKHFEGIPRINAAPFSDAALPEQTSQRTAVVSDANARAPGVLYGWATAAADIRGSGSPPAPSAPSLADHAGRHALEVTAILLGGGEASRLHQLLVRDRALAQSVSADLDARRGPGLFMIDARLAAGAKVGDVERLIEGEIKALAARGPSDAELARARRLAGSRLVFGLQRSSDRAVALGERELFFGDARTLNGELGRYLAVTKADVQRVARETLSPLRRNIVETYPAPSPEAPAPAAKPAAAKPAAPAAHHEKKAGKAGAKDRGGAKPKKKK